MFPIGDDNTGRRTVPLVTFGLIAVNVLFFFAELSGGGGLSWHKGLVLSVLAATAAQLAFSTESNVPNLGASGAIAGVLGAYILMFPQGKVNVLMGRGVVPMPALVVIGLWIVLQLFSGFGSLTTTTTVQSGGVAYMAHIGGFVAGLVLTFLLRGNPRLQARI